jgi:hypothetical protein
MWDVLKGNYWWMFWGILWCRVSFQFLLSVQTFWSSKKNIWDKTIWRTLHFFRNFWHSNQTSVVSECSNVLFIFFDFCSCRVLSKTEENTEKYFLIKKICKEQKIWRTLQKKPWNLVMLGLMQSSLQLEFVEKNFVLTKVQATYSY